MEEEGTYDREHLEFQCMKEAMFLASTTIPGVPGEIHPYVTLLNSIGEYKQIFKSQERMQIFAGGFTITAEIRGEFKRSVAL